MDRCVAGDLVAAYAHVRCELLPHEGPQRLIRCLAVSLPYRRQGGEIADAALEHALGTVRGADPEAPSILVLAKVDTRNAPSEALFRRVGFDFHARLTDGVEGSELGLWGLLV
ncbi:GNAT family N-acetyltransferase [Streptomyces alkaliphilus]|uniref:GNAT family N-acetyltransferase n=1 Tax=Streptomyces alkaliphilus TaxID=1472722 RepID=UPI00117F77F2|nr:GNAT family N-acetyltransferase [Streptomyces alkaliphilus]MQS10177.1 hypothetical protein [Streptomyces alkaliphilus]